MRVLLVNMPFGAIRPAIGPSLLKSHLQRAGHEARVAYLNMRFAQRLGASDFTYIADRTPTQSLAGDWVFARCLFGPREAADEAYAEDFRERFGIYSSPEAPLATLRRARDLAEEFIEESVAEVPWDDYDVVGFTSTFTQHAAALALARRVKERDAESTIVFGGANCEEQMGLSLHRMFPFVDYVCSGEADISFPRLIEALRGGEDPAGIPGVIARGEGGSTFASLLPERVRDLDQLPYPDFGDYFEQVEGSKLGRSAILMESSRGCWWGEKHHCTFCGLNGLGMTFRRKSAERVLEELDTQTERYGVRHVEMVDNILDMRYFRDLIPELGRRQMNLALFYETKANLSKGQVRELQAAGVTAIQPGIESFSTSVLRIMRKGSTGLQNIQLLKWCKELGVKVYWNLLYGFPGEDPAEYQRMADVIECITHLEPPQGMGAIRLDRFSPNFSSADELGLRDVRPDRSYGQIYDRPEEELADLAYYFEHDYADGRDPRAYVGETESAVERWLKGSGGRGLISVDHGEELALWDFRQAAAERLTVLSGDQRALYLHCDEQRSPSALSKFARRQGMDEANLQEHLERLCATRLMLCLDDRYLALAVPTQPTPTHPTEHRPLAAAAF